MNLLADESVGQEKGTSVFSDRGKDGCPLFRFLFCSLGEGMKVREVIKRLEADCWYRIRSKSGHRQFKHPVKKGRVTVAGQLNVDVPIKTLKSIWIQAQLPEED